MNKETFKREYSRVRRINFNADVRMQSLPCGEDDAVGDSARYAIEDICKANPGLGDVLEMRYDQDILSEPLCYRYNRGAG